MINISLGSGRIIRLCSQYTIITPVDRNTSSMNSEDPIDIVQLLYNDIRDITRKWVLSVSLTDYSLLHMME